MAADSGSPSAIAKASPPFFVEHDYEDFVQQIADLSLEEDSVLWLHIGEVLERLVPGINPFDRREATAEILSPIRKAFADEFC